MKSKTEESLRNQLDEVIAAYDALVARSDELAEMLLLKDNRVLGKVMPAKAGDRRETGHIREWFEHALEKSLDTITAETEARERESEREELIKSLGITEDQRKLLFS